MFFRPGENPWIRERVPEGCGHGSTSKASSTRKGAFLMAEQQGFEEAGPCKAVVKNMPVACFGVRVSLSGLFSWQSGRS